RRRGQCVISRLRSGRRGQHWRNRLTPEAADELLGMVLFSILDAAKRPLTTAELFTELERLLWHGRPRRLHTDQARGIVGSCSSAARPGGGARERANSEPTGCLRSAPVGA